MASTSKFFRYTLPFVYIVYTANLSFIFCAEIRKGVLLPDWEYDDDYENWKREYLSIIKKPYFRWKDFTPRPPDDFTPSIDERDLYTPSTTVNDDFEHWWKEIPTIDPKDPDFWKKIFTLIPPDDRNLNIPSTTVNDDFIEDWWKKFRTLDPQDPDFWKKIFTLIPPDEKDISTTVDDWRKKYFTTTKKPYIFLKKLTLAPFVERDNYSSNRNSSYIGIIVVGLLIVLLTLGVGVIYIKNHVNQDMNRNTAASSADNRLTNSRPSRNNRNVVNATENLPGATGMLNNATDKPPSYDVVVLGDLGVQQTIYPGVKTDANIPECPPPKYEDSVQKY